MQISNLGELLNATLIHEGSVLSVEGFAINLNELKAGFAFFNNDKKEITQAVKKGAYVIITENDITLGVENGGGAGCRNFSNHPKVKSIFLGLHKLLLDVLHRV